MNSKKPIPKFITTILFVSATEVILVCDQSACEPKFEPQGQVSQQQFVSITNDVNNHSFRIDTTGQTV